MDDALMNDRQKTGRGIRLNTPPMSFRSVKCDLLWLVWLRKSGNGRGKKVRARRVARRTRERQAVEVSRQSPNCNLGCPFHHIV